MEKEIEAMKFVKADEGAINGLVDFYAEPGSNIQDNLIFSNKPKYRFSQY